MFKIYQKKGDYNPLFFCLILTFFIYSLFNNFYFHLDDLTLLNRIATHDYNFIKKFFPTTKPYYFRPVLSTTFYLDTIIHNANPYLMRLENIILHILNIFLLHNLLKNIFKKKTIFITLLFAITPINTESINWISGRTDILATFFSLLSLNVLFLKYNKIKIMLLSCFLFLLGLLSKEVAIGVLPVLIFIALKFLKFNKKLFILFFFFLMLTLILYLLMRFPELRFWTTKFHQKKFSLPSGPKVSKNPINTDNYLIMIKQFISIIGFYIKKTFFPWPQNFAIIKTKSFFNYIFLILLLLIVILKPNRYILFGLLWFLSFIAPALLIPLNRMAWTPVAERYLYLPQIGLFIIVIESLTIKLKPIFLIYIFYLILFLISLIYRSYLWSNPERLYVDTIKKSPKFSPIYNELGCFYHMEQKYKKAKLYISKAIEIEKNKKFKNKIKLNLILIDLEKNSLPYNLKKFDNILIEAHNKKFKKKILLTIINYINQYSLKHPSRKNNLILNLKIKYFKKLVSLYPNNKFYNYKLGALYYAKKNYKLAKKFLTKAKNKNSFYSKALLIMLKHIENSKN